MRVEIVEQKGTWLDVKTRALNTIGMEKAKTLPNNDWKIAHLQSEHSPIRDMEFVIRFYDVPYFVHTHLVRHHIGTQWYISTSRTDRTGTTQRPSQEALIDFTGVLNVQALLSISRKRLCMLASKETRELWRMVKNAIAEYDREIAQCMTKECVYRGFCPEWKSCGYCGSGIYNEDREAYINLRIRKED